jgi:protein-S-isoprenylcysteine O-methyltransferase Ste14
MPRQDQLIFKGSTAKRLIIQSVGGFLVGGAALGVVIFLPAWTVDYWQAWVFIVVFMGLVMASSAYFSITDPALIERRKQVEPAAQKSGGGKFNIFYVYIALLAMLVLAGLDHRLGWSQMPAGVSILGDGLVVAANAIWLVSKKENSFAGSAIKVYEGQKVVTSGPYAWVRHPNYAGDLCLVLGIPLALGCWWGLGIFALLIPMMVWMIHDEETFLKKELAGYEEYMQKVRYRLVPKVW